jgi:peroxiredoxin
MTVGTILGALSFVTAASNIAFYYPKIKGNRASLRPRREQALMVLALLFAVGSFFMHPGIVGYVLGGGAVVPASLFLLGTSTSGLPDQRPSVAVGSSAPNFTALDADGLDFRLADLRGSHVLLKFYRGYWCPYCVAELTQLNNFAKDFAALGVEIVAVSSDRVDELREFKLKHVWDIKLVADPALAAHRLYNVQSRNFAPKRGPFRDLAIPTTMLIDKYGRVLWIQQSTDFRERPQASAVLAEIKSLLSNIQPNENAEGLAKVSRSSFFVTPYDE